MGRTQSLVPLSVRVLTGRNGVVVRAMGAAIEKALFLAFELQRRNYAIGILTGTAEVVDDVIPDDNVHSCLMIADRVPGYGIG
jgi:hypothetical protein